MKNLFLSTLLIFSYSAYAQSLPNTIQLNSNQPAGFNTYESSDASGNTQSVLSPTPGLYIYTPQWTKDVVNVGKDMVSNKSSNNQSASRETNISPNNTPTLVSNEENSEDSDSEDINSTDNGDSSQVNQNVKRDAQIMNNLAKKSQEITLPTLPQSSVTKNTTSNVEKRKVGQVLDTSAISTYTKSISGWNKTTQNEFESLGQRRLQQSYQNFLMDE